MAPFDPVSALIGGALIGLASVLLMVFTGRIAGISGIAAGLLTMGGDKGWRLAFIAGLIAAPLLGALVVVAGLLVGFGVRLAGGCTSGHGICGIARFSLRSVVATVVFVATAIVIVTVVRHGLGG
jgi:uncharacterized membrane protein YedE/YeeE